MLTICQIDTHMNLRALLTLLHSERPKLYTILAFLSAMGLKRSRRFFLCVC